jgi:acyl-coenzyme A synthetase/AMP-(fatty) acid ligase
MHAGAFNWTYTLGTGLMDPWTLGATALIPQPGTVATALPGLLKDHRATIFAAAPGVYRQMLRADIPPLPHLRHGLSAGEALPLALRQEWQAKTGSDIHEAFGMSEVSTFLSGSPSRPAPPGRSGFAQPGRKIAVLDGGLDGVQPAATGTPGILAVSRDDPGLFLGYFNDKAATEAKFAGDWFLTGDTALMDEDGAVTYLGRSDDMMNAGGYRVSPLEVEAAMAAYAAIQDCGAVELEVKPGTKLIALAYVADQRIADADLADFAAQTLARYKQPRLWHRVEALPRNANGKVNRQALRQILSAPSPLPEK